MIYYTIYKITNQINGKIYIGSHKTKNLNDNYMGSGKYLKYSQSKHGIENFTKEILFVFDNPADMYAKEAELVNEEFIAEENTYNLKIGGHGGFDHLNTAAYKNPTHSSVHTTRMSNIGLVPRLQSLREYFATDLHKEQCQQIADRKKKTSLRKYGDESEIFRTFTGRTHTDETKAKMRTAAKKRLSDPTNNPSYGTCWIHSLEECRSQKINKDDLDEWLTRGWIQGRKMKF